MPLRYTDFNKTPFKEHTLYFYVDESGHTGPNLFDADQPTLYYGVLSSSADIDTVTVPQMAAMRRLAGVDQLHANQLGNGGLVHILPALQALQRDVGFRFDLYRINKPDHAIICFFDQIFDSDINPAMTWAGYRTPLRYVLLFKVAYLFDEALAKAAWEARISTNNEAASEQIGNVCRGLLERINGIPDARSRDVIGDTLAWAINNTQELRYNARSEAERLQIMPNIIGFQSVMHGITLRIKESGTPATSIIVDQQSQFNKAQRTLAEFYASAASQDIEWKLGPGLPTMDLKNMPDTPLTFTSSTKSAGLELVDIHLWVFKRMMERKEVAPPLYAIFAAQMRDGLTDEISLAALSNRWTPFFENLPELGELSAEQIEFANQFRAEDEARRTAAVRATTVKKPKR